MEIPALFGRKKSQRPRPPEDVEYGGIVHRRFSRAYGVLALLKRELGEGIHVTREMRVYKEDCQGELIDAHASDAYHGFLEREFGIRFRLELGSVPKLHAVKDAGLPKLESELLARLDRRGMEHAYAFGIGVLNGAITSFARRKDPEWVYEPPVGEKSPEMLGMRAAMGDFAYREDFQRRSDYKVGFLTPNRLTFSRHSARPLSQPGLVDQLRLEHLIREPKI